jgi:hypothetical protein
MVRIDDTDALRAWVEHTVAPLADYEPAVTMLPASNKIKHA